MTILLKIRKEFDDINPGHELVQTESCADLCGEHRAAT